MSNNLSHQIAQLDCNNKYIYGTQLVKKVNGISFKGIVKYYDKEKKFYHIRYTGGEEEDTNTGGK